MSDGKRFSREDQQCLQEVMLHRRDVRGNHFTSTPVCDDTVRQILLAGVQAPSVGFSQPWEFVIIRDPATRQQVVDSFTEENHKARKQFSDQEQQKYTQLKLEGILEAPVNIAVFYKPSSQPVLGQTSMKEMGKYSVVCAVQNMWLMARALNIGMGWVSILDPHKVKHILNAPAENQLIAYLCLGHVKEFLDQPELELLQWKKRKAMGSVVFQEKYTAKE